MILPEKIKLYSLSSDFHAHLEKHQYNQVGIFHAISYASSKNHIIAVGTNILSFFALLDNFQQGRLNTKKTYHQDSTHSTFVEQINQHYANAALNISAKIIPTQEQFSLELTIEEKNSITATLDKYDCSRISTIGKYYLRKYSTI